MHLPKIFVFLLMASVCTQRQTALRIKITAHSELRPRHAMMAPGERTWVVHATNDRTRTETSASRSPATVTIQRCDTHKIYTFDVERREYTESSLPSGKNTSSSTEQETDSSPNLLIDTTTRDTGETKSAFGYSAHHYIIRTKETPSAEFNEQPSERMVDAWYLNVPDVMTCEPVLPWRENPLFVGFVRTELFGHQMMSRVRPEFKFSGPEPQGLFLSETATSNWIEVLATGEQQENVLYEWRKIVEMSAVPVDSSLFEVPAGFTKVKGIRPKY